MSSERSAWEYEDGPEVGRDVPITSEPRDERGARHPEGSGAARAGRRRSPSLKSARSESPDPALDSGVNQRLTEEVREVLGTDRVSVPKDRTRPSRGDRPAQAGSHGRSEQPPTDRRHAVRGVLHDRRDRVPGDRQLVAAARRAGRACARDNPGHVHGHAADDDQRARLPDRRGDAPRGRSLAIPTSTSHSSWRSSASTNTVTRATWSLLTRPPRTAASTRTRRGLRQSRAQR